MQEDPLLYSFSQDEEGEDDDATALEKEEIIRDLREFGEICIDDGDIIDALATDFDTLNEDRREGASASNGYYGMENISEKEIGSCIGAKEHVGSFKRKPKDKHLRVSFANVVSKEIKNVNENYFGAYSSFGIHREMISDKVRMDAYRQAILNNPSLIKGATVLDVGCGTGILRNNRFLLLSRKDPYFEGWYLAPHWTSLFPRPLDDHLPCRDEIPPHACDTGYCSNFEVLLIEVAYLYILFIDNEPSFCLFNLVLSKIIIISQDTLLGLFLIFSVTSLFAAQAGASRVIAVEASEKMASVATQVAKDNGLLWSASPNAGNNHYTGVIKVVQGMVEELDKSIESHSIDVLLSEWMGYCLLYESMLSSVLFARDHWLKPGGAILPDTATIFVAGFGKGGTSIPFWENVYGFNMSCVGKELVEDAAQTPIVDIVDSHDIVTDAAVLQTFDLVTMKPEEMDFTASIRLQPKLDRPADTNASMDLEQKPTWCHGVVLWFETGFTSRFCRETSTILSTSPFTPKTHWSQTILTFREPIAMAAGKPNAKKSEGVGSDACPASSIHLRISIIRAAQHRSIDISLETTGIACDGRKHSWPVQIFNLS
ncbi:putative protein arginine N-methyltransferase 3 [Vitis vinifera]|uniref:type I protein arginine methyltransferase n=1 Tax=Vitis vinifera TaxID=29760 RepID=A0A438DLS1_VITVI|nr:putative protein arginine N-methyltransferase 3 [Vitis vinifera]